MLTTSIINQLLDINESYQASDKLSTILQNKESREKLFKQFLQYENDLSFDWFTDYFQAEHSDRKGKKQDFTPTEIGQLLSKLLAQTSSNADICAGTGGLTIQRYNENKNATFYCEEFSDRAFPFLLFNMCIRNVNATLVHGDSLTRDIKQIYKLTKDSEFSNIENVSCTDSTFETIVMNPPYSLPWTPDKVVDDKRFKDFNALAPKSKADYAFIQTGLSMLSETGRLAVILPHGVLFRGASEGKIRKQLLENNLLDCVIGLPSELFLNTAIPTCILIFKKDKTDTDVLFIDAKDSYEKGKNQNKLRNEDVQQILSVYQSRSIVDKFSNLVSFEEIKENDYNLNIPRYVDTFEPEEIISLKNVVAELNEIDNKINQVNTDLANHVSELRANNDETSKDLIDVLNYLLKWEKTND